MKVDQGVFEVDGERVGSGPCRPQFLLRVELGMTISGSVGILTLSEGLSNESCNQGGWGYWRAAVRRPSKVMSKAFSTVFHRMVQRVCPLPVGSRDMIAM